MYDKEAVGINYEILSCHSRDFDARTIGLEALQLRQVLRLVCVQIHEDVKIFTSAPPMLYFCSGSCLRKFNKRFPHDLRSRVKRIVVHRERLELDVIDVEEERKVPAAMVSHELDVEYPCVPDDTWCMEWHG